MLATVRAAPPPAIPVHALSRPPTHVQPKVKPPPPPKKLKNPLQVLEIIAKILGYNDKATNARCARVCRVWMEISLNNLWSELEGVKDLLSILVPLKKPKTGDYWIMERAALNVSVHAIHRFRFYASRVKKLTILPSNKLVPRVHQSVLDLLSRCVGGFALPKLEYLAIYMHMDPNVRWFRYIPLFFNMHLKSAAISYPIRFDEDMKGEANVMVAQMGEFAKMLTGLMLMIPNGHGEAFESGISELLPKMVYLKTLVIHGIVNPKHFIPTISQLKLLKTLQISSKTESQTPIGIGNNTKFPRLTTLATTLQLLLDGPGRFSALQILHFEFLRVEDTSHIGPLLRSLATSCPVLEELHIDFFRSTLPVYDDTIERDGIGLCTLQPLERLPKLCRFSLAHTDPVGLSDSELVTLVSGCPNLKELKLVSEPTSVLPSRLSVNVLSRLARLAMCRLTKLAIYARTSRIVAHSPSPFISPPPTPGSGGLSSLELISFGHSPIASGCETKVADYLRGVLPRTCRIVGPQSTVIKRIKMGQEGLGEAILREREEREGAWVIVSRLFKK